MKNLKTIGILCAATLLVGVTAAFAQDTNAQGGGPGGGRGGRGGGPGGPGGPGGRGGIFGADLSQEEAKSLADARQKAMSDPTVVSLMEARKSVDQQIENAMDQAMLAADPNVGSTLEKVRQARERAQEMRARFDALTPEQKESLRSAQQAARQDPAVTAAREQMRSATTPEARREAWDAMRDAMKAAVTKNVSPELASLVEDMGPMMGGRGGPGRPGGGAAPAADTQPAQQ